MEALKIVQDSLDLARIMGSHEFFPIIIVSDKNEYIKFDKRPRKTDNDIVDIYSNDIHIGMFIGIKKEADVLKFGEMGINNSHRFRKILSFGFAKLLEYYGIDGITKIEVNKPDCIEFIDFLKQIGFTAKDHLLVLEIPEKKKSEFLMKLQEHYPEILDREGQIKNLVLRHLPDENERVAQQRTNKIIQKVKYRDRLGGEFWDFRSIMKLKNTLNVAIAHETKDVFHNHLNTGKLLEDKILNEEFFDFFIKTLITSFKPYIREAYLEEIFKVIDGEVEFPIAYVQDLIEKFMKLKGDDTLDRDKYRNWVKKHQPMWDMRAKIQEEKEAQILEQSKLEPSDFAPNIKEELRPMITLLVDHYNNNKIFFGMENSFK